MRYRPATHSTILAGVLVCALGVGVTACQLVSGIADLVVDLPRDGGSETGPGDGAAGATADAESDAGATAITLEIRRIGNAVLASVTINGSEVCRDDACDGTRSIDVSVGTTTIIATAKGDADAHFRAPSACKGTGNACTFAADMNAATPKKAVLQVVDSNYVFITSTKYDGNLGGLTGADTKCNDAATSAGLPGKYVAWLSDTGTDARDRLSGARGWRRVDGLPFADALSSAGGTDLTEGKVFYPVVLDENGNSIAKGDHVFTGTRANGKALGGYSCDSWYSESASLLAIVGSPLGGSVSWTNLESLGTCNESRHLYCFRKDRSTTVHVPDPPNPSRRAFLSKTALATSAGLGAADAICNGEAVNLGSTTGFLAYLATTTTAASSRFDPSPSRGGWFRLDKVPVFADPTQLVTAEAFPAAPVTQHADTTYISDQPSVLVLAWTGINTDTNQPATGPGFTCDDWATTTTSSSLGQVGHIAKIDSAFVRDRVVPCDQQWPVVCLEQ
ncbi:MAG TPA: hypothetical protein VM580_09315 [Labilithrix sp.]|jgi:hypothetical protein|nr:hypothetical protein [Labilithrix sp.]